MMITKLEMTQRYQISKQRQTYNPDIRLNYWEKSRLHVECFTKIMVAKTGNLLSRQWLRKEELHNGRLRQGNRLGGVVVRAAKTEFLH